MWCGQAEAVYESPSTDQSEAAMASRNQEQAQRASCYIHLLLWGDHESMR